MGNPLRGNFTGIRIITGHFDNIRAKGPAIAKDSATHAAVQVGRSSKGMSSKLKRDSKRKIHLPQSSSEIFLKLNEDTPFREAMDSKKK